MGGHNVTQEEIADRVLTTITNGLDSYIQKLKGTVEQDIKKAVYNYIGIDDRSYEPTIKRNSILEEHLKKILADVVHKTSEDIDLSDVKLTAVAKKRILKDAQIFLESQLLTSIRAKISNGPQNITELDIKIGAMIDKQTKLMETLLNAKHES